MMIDVRNHLDAVARGGVTAESQPMGAENEHGPAATLPPARERWSRIALGLVVATLGYNVLEAVVALWSGARAESIALLGFGLDSVIECAAAGVLLWRLRLEARGAEPETLERTEQRVHRFVGATFFALSLYVIAEAGWTLWTRDAPRVSIIGIVIATASLVVMPLVSWGKLHAAEQIGSLALRAEA